MLGGRWAGFAIGELAGGEQTIFFFPGINEGARLGILDRERAIKLTGAIAQDPTHGYGGISRWFVEEARRGNPDDLRCSNCETVGCGGDCADDSDDYESVDMI